MPIPKVDAADLRLLDAIQQECGLTSEVLAERVNLSATAVQRRLKKLRAMKVIEKEVAVLNPKLLGRPTSMLLHVILERTQADVIDRFKKSIKLCDEVMMGYHVTGEVDFILVVTAPSIEGFQKFIQDFLYKLPEVKTFKTFVVLDRVKTGYTIPLDVSAEDMQET